MTPLAILVERAEAALLTHGASAREELIRQIERAIRADEDPGRVRDLDHILQLIEFHQPRLRTAGIARYLR